MGSLRIWVEALEDVPPGWSSGADEMLVVVQHRSCGRLEEDGLMMVPAEYRVSGPGPDAHNNVRFPAAGFIEVPITDGGQLCFKLRYRRGRLRRHGTFYAEIGAKDLARQKIWRLLLGRDDTNGSPEPVYGVSGSEYFSHWLGSEVHADPVVRRPAFIRLRTEARSCDLRQQEDPDFVPHRRRPQDPLRRRVMMLTRGTRGDVQPFLVLARGLILHHNCEVIIVAEVKDKEFIKRARRGLPPGSLLFRPTGGDTSKQTGSLAKVIKAGQHLDLLQSVMLSFAEVNFFRSEGTCFYWAFEENPHLVVFAFTMQHIAAIISEALEIPILGFILQAAHHIQARGHELSQCDKLLEPFRNAVSGPNCVANFKHYMEHFHPLLTVNELRRSRGLRPDPAFSSNGNLQYEALCKQGVPFIVPIPQLVMEGHEQPGQTYADFALLRLDDDMLSPEMRQFIDAARKGRNQVGVMTFSSMPFGERAMVDVALDICNHCRVRSGSEEDRQKFVLIVFAVGQERDPATAEQLAEVGRLRAEGRILLAYKPEPFDKLFPEADFLIAHGGLGVTSEALVAGIPIITTGVQLMDQRWWGARVAALGCGSPGIPFYKLQRRGRDGRRKVVDLVDQALDQRDADSDGEPTWSRRAREVKKQLEASVATGVAENASKVHRLGVETPAVVRDLYGDEPGLCSRGCWIRQASCCCDNCARLIYFLLMLELPACCRCLLHYASCAPCRRRYAERGAPKAASSDGSDGTCTTLDGSSCGSDSSSESDIEGNPLISPRRGPARSK